MEEYFIGYAFLGVIVLAVIFIIACFKDSKYKSYYKTLVNEARLKNSNIVITKLLCQKKYHFYQELIIGVENFGDKVIKYITIHANCFNNVNDYLYSCDYKGSGFLAKGQQSQFDFDVRDNSVSSVEIVSVEVVYTDNTEKTFDKKDLTIGKGYFIDETNPSILANLL